MCCFWSFCWEFTLVLQHFSVWFVWIYWWGIQKILCVSASMCISGVNMVDIESYNFLLCGLKCNITELLIHLLLVWYILWQTNALFICNLFRVVIVPWTIAFTISPVLVVHYVRSFQISLFCNYGYVDWFNCILK